jgi:hypothetical protein
MKFEDISAPVLDEIGIERERQKLVEGYSTDHDDEHDSGELACAAAALAILGTHQPVDSVTALWPFEEPVKSKGARRNLIRAGALIVAEIDRLDRKAAKVAQPATTLTTDGKNA